jgi:hypothetical protein
VLVCAPVLTARIVVIGLRFVVAVVVEAHHLNLLKPQPQVMGPAGTHTQKHLQASEKW